MEICVIGAGYVGLVTAVCVAELGNNVRCLDIDEERVEALINGKVPFHEPGLEEMMRRNIEKGRFLFTTDVEEAVKGTEVVYIAVGTPMNPDDGSVNLDYVKGAARDIAPYLSSGMIVVDKSTVPVGTARTVKSILIEAGAPHDVQVVSNPEFLREGTAVCDFMEPDRVILGTDTEKAAETMKSIYRPLAEQGCEILITSPEAAELTKYASNAFLAVKLTFINEIALLADNAGIDVLDVARGVGLDKRIGTRYLMPGPGYGGSCLPKDTSGLLHIGRSYNSQLRLVEAAVTINHSIPAILIRRVGDALGGLTGKRIGLLGLTFKAGTDDVRESPAIDLAKGFLEFGASVTAYDPKGIELAKCVLGDSIAYADSSMAAISGANVAVIATDWPEFTELKLSQIAETLSGDLLADFRNIFDPKDAEEAGLRYMGMGRGRLGS